MTGLLRSPKYSTRPKNDALEASFESDSELFGSMDGWREGTRETKTKICFIQYPRELQTNRTSFNGINTVRLIVNMAAFEKLIMYVTIARFVLVNKKNKKTLDFLL